MTAVYLQRKPRPIARPTISQSRVLPSGCAARQPTTIAHVQQRTNGGSTVIKIVPRPSSGVAVAASSSQNDGRAPISRARKRSSNRLVVGAASGEKKRTAKVL